MRRICFGIAQRIVYLLAFLSIMICFWGIDNFYNAEYNVVPKIKHVVPKSNRSVYYAEYNVVPKIKHVVTKSNRSVCDVYDVRTPPTSNNKCVVLKQAPYPKVCIYKAAEDQWISGGLEKSGTWEQSLVTCIYKELMKNENLGLLDLGANLGVFTLMAAKMGRPVVAVEPTLETLKILHQSISLNKLEDKVTLVSNCVSNKREEFKIAEYSDNRGGNNMIPKDQPCNTQKNKCNQTVKCVLMDDLLDVIPFRDAVMKVDIEGFENFAFQHAEKLFRSMNITVVLMEWLGQRRNYNKPKTSFEDKFKLTEQMISFFTENKFAPYIVNANEKLDPKKWGNWPDNIIWRK